MNEMIKDNDVISLKNIFMEFAQEFHLAELKNLLQNIKDPLESDSLDLMLEVIKSIRSNVEAKLDEMYDSTSYSKEDIEKFMSNPDNFSKREWAVIEGTKRKVEEYTKEFQIASQGAGIREIVKEGRRRQQRKKGKLSRLDSSKKKWISM